MGISKIPDTHPVVESYRVFIGYIFWPVLGPLSLILTNIRVITRKARHKSAHFIAIWRRNLVYLVANLVPIPDIWHPTISRRVRVYTRNSYPRSFCPWHPYPYPYPTGFSLGCTTLIMSRSKRAIDYREERSKISKSTVRVCTTRFHTSKYLGIVGTIILLSIYFSFYTLDPRRSHRVRIT